MDKKAGENILPDTFYDTVIIPLKNTEKFWWFSLKNESKGVYSEDVISIFYMCQYFPAWNMENFIFHAGKSMPITSSVEYGKFHIPYRKISAHNFLYEIWKILIEIIYFQENESTYSHTKARLPETHRKRPLKNHTCVESKTRHKGAHLWSRKGLTDPETNGRLWRFGCRYCQTGVEVKR